MNDYLQANQQLWNEWTALHEQAPRYKLAGFKAGASTLRPVERAELTNVTGKRLLHLQCHFGLDTLSWARQGAAVTDVDLSVRSIVLARSLSAELQIPATFVCADVLDLANVLTGQYEIIFTSYGVLNWLRDLPRWATVIAHFLQPGGIFYMVEFHPFGLSSVQTNDWINHLLQVLQLTFHHLTNANPSANCIQFLQLLNSYQVEYLIVGGHAVAFHGYRRPILDLDIFIDTHPVNAQRLVQVLHAFGHAVAAQAAEIFQMPERVIQLGQPPFTIERFTPEKRIIQIGTTPKQLEILTAISTVTFAECYQERVSGVINDVPVPMIGLAHLKRNKQASIRLKDADDLAHLDELVMRIIGG